MSELDGRVAIVTGGAWGIGRGISQALCAQGATVVIADRHPERGCATALELTTEGQFATFIACDVADPASVQAMVNETVSHFGGIDILVNNAGIPGSNNIAHEVELDDWDRVIGVNLRGVFLCARAALPHLITSGRGTMINIASTFGMIGAHGSAAYAASKGGVIALSRQLAVEYGPHGVRVNAVSPGFIDTDMADRRTFMTPEAAAANLLKRESTAALQPVGRQAQPREVGEVVAFLASDRASFMTGAVVPVDGGCTASFNSGSR